MKRREIGFLLLTQGLMISAAGAVLAVGAALWGDARLLVIIGLVALIVHMPVAGLGAYLRR